MGSPQNCGWYTLATEGMLIKKCWVRMSGIVSFLSENEKETFPSPRNQDTQIQKTNHSQGPHVRLLWAPPRWPAGPAGQ